MSQTLGFTGDVMLGRHVDRVHRDGPPETVWGSALPLLRSCDGLFVNLECCLSTRGRQWTRTRRAFHFRADPDWAVSALAAAGVDWTALANNHLLDFEEEALLDTLDHLDGATVGHAGAGPDAEAARSPSIVAIGDLRVGLFSLTDNTPEYAAGPESPGVARIEMADAGDSDRRVVDGILAALERRSPDLIVASLHWGPNNVVTPEEGYREFGHWLLERGVDVVHGHSAHVFQGVERYDGGLILHDCGDFVDDYRVNPTLQNDRSFLFELAVSDDGALERLVLRPVEIEQMAVDAVDDDGTEWWRETMRERSEPFGSADAFEREGAGLVLPL